MSNNQPPIETLRDGALSATIWKNQGEKGAFYSVIFGRTYTDDDQRPQTSNSFSGAELLKIGRLAGKAYDRIATLRQHDRVDAQAE